MHLDGFAHALDLVAAEVVHDDGVAGCERERSCRSRAGAHVGRFDRRGYALFHDGMDQAQALNRQSASRPLLTRAIIAMATAHWR